MRAGRALARRWLARDGFSARRGLRRLHVHGHIPLKLHGFRFNSICIMTYAAFGVRDSRDPQKPVTHGLAPDDRVSFLVFQPSQDKFIALLGAEQATNGLARGDEVGAALGAHLVSVIALLNHGPDRLQLLSE